LKELINQFKPLIKYIFRYCFFRSGSNCEILGIFFVQCKPRTMV